MAAIRRPARSGIRLAPLPSSSAGSEQLSVAMKEAALKIHDQAMAPSVIQHLLEGTLPIEAYITYLMTLYMLYSALEDSLSRNASHPYLAAVYDPATLHRAPALHADIAYWSDDPTWDEITTSPSLGTSSARRTWRTLRENPPNALKAYIDRLRILGGTEERDETVNDIGDPACLLAHAYVRYMGDASGGSFIARSISSAYRPLRRDGDDCEERGLAFYDFSSSSSTTPQSRSTQALKTWFRNGVDTTGHSLAANGHQSTRTAILEETTRAFEMNISLFEDISRLLGLRADPLDDSAIGLTQLEREIHASQQPASSPSGPFASPLSPLGMAIHADAPLALTIASSFPQLHAEDGSSSEASSALSSPAFAPSFFSSSTPTSEAKSALVDRSGLGCPFARLALVQGLDMPASHADLALAGHEHKQKTGGHWIMPLVIIIIAAVTTAMVNIVFGA